MTMMEAQKNSHMTMMEAKQTVIFLEKNLSQDNGGSTKTET